MSGSLDQETTTRSPDRHSPSNNPKLSYGEAVRHLERTIQVNDGVLEPYLQNLTEATPDYLHKKSLDNLVTYIMQKGDVSNLNLGQIQQSLEMLDRVKDNPKDPRLKKIIDKLKTTLEEQKTQKEKDKKKEEAKAAINGLVMDVNSFVEQRRGSLKLDVCKRKVAELQRLVEFYKDELPRDSWLYKQAEQALHQGQQRLQDEERLAKQKETTTAGGHSLEEWKKKYPDLAKTLGDQFTADLAASIERAQMSAYTEHAIALENKIKASGDNYKEKFYHGYQDEEKYHEIAKEISETENWKKYGWSWAQQGNVTQILTKSGFNMEERKVIKEFLLMHGQTGADAIRLLEDLGYFNNGIVKRESLLHAVLDFAHPYEDEELLKILIPNNKERHDYLYNLYQRKPTNIEEFAFQVAHSAEHLFGHEGKYPVFEKRIKIKEETILDEDGKEQEIERIHTRMVVNSDNLTMWLRERISYLDEQNTKSPVNFYDHVQLEKEMYNLKLAQIFEGAQEILRDKDGNFFEFLFDQWNLEAIFIGAFRNWGIQFQQVAGNEEQLTKFMNENFYWNDLTRPIFGQSILYWVNVMPERFTGAVSDGKVGGMINQLFLAFCNIANPDALKEVLGVQDLSAVFNLNKQLRPARDNVYYKKIKDKRGGYKSADDWLDLNKASEKMQEIFDVETGNIKPGKERALLDYLNPYGKQTYDEQLANVLQNMLKDYVVRQQKVSRTENANIAAMLAWNMAIFMGGAEQSDTSPQGHWAGSRRDWFYPIKQVEDAKRGGGAGSVWGMGQFKSWYVFMMHAIQNKHGKSIYQVFEDVMRDRRVLNQEIENELKNDVNQREIEQRMRKKLEEMSEEEKNEKLREKIEEKAHKMRNSLPDVQSISELDKYVLEREALKEFLTEMRNEVEENLRNELWMNRQEGREVSKAEDYHNAAADFVFDGNASRHFVLNQFNRSNVIDEYIRGGKRIQLGTYTSYTPEVGVTFDWSKFQGDVVKGLITPVRYFLATYGKLDYSMPIWIIDYARPGDPEYDPKKRLLIDQKKVFRKVPLGEKMFGYQMLNRKEFWKRKRDKNGKLLKDSYYRGEIDWRRVTGNDEEQIKLGDDEQQITKAWVLTDAARMILEDKENRPWATGERHDFMYYEKIIQALEKIPGDVAIDEGDMRNTNVPRRYFSRADIRWLRKVTGLTRKKMDFLWLLKDLFVGKKGSKEELLLAGYLEIIGLFLRGGLRKL